jgi:hypothetical protein
LARATGTATRSMTARTRSSTTTPDSERLLDEAVPRSRRAEPHGRLPRHEVEGRGLSRAPAITSRLGIRPQRRLVIAWTGAILGQEASVASGPADLIFPRAAAGANRRGRSSSSATGRG